MQLLMIIISIAIRFCALISMIFLTGCNTTTSTIHEPDISRAKTPLELEPVEFTIVIHDDVVYYALTDENYINLGMNMLRIQQALYALALWEKTHEERRRAGTDSTQDNGD